MVLQSFSKLNISKKGPSGSLLLQSLLAFISITLVKFRKKDFECSFHLWGKGGPNWKFEESKYYKELDAKWTMVNRSRPSVFDRLQLSSSACATVPIASVFPV